MKLKDRDKTPKKMTQVNNNDYFRFLNRLHGEFEFEFNSDRTEVNMFDDIGDIIGTRFISYNNETNDTYEVREDYLHLCNPYKGV